MVGARHSSECRNQAPAQERKEPFSRLERGWELLAGGGGPVPVASRTPPQGGLRSPALSPWSPFCAGSFFPIVRRGAVCVGCRA